MSYNLCIDLGNTRAKWALFAGKEPKPEEQYVCTADELLQSLQQNTQDKTVANIIVSSVVDEVSGLMDWVKEHSKFHIVLNESTRLPFINAYRSADTLGADRLALAAGALGLYPNKASLVISLGTCVTYNFVLSNLFFRGGAIAPGMLMRFQAMKDYTDQLPLVHPQGDAPILGYDTETSIRSGVVNGMVAEIEGMIEAYRKEMKDDFNPILTGGDLGFFEPLIKNKIFAHPDLLMIGLNEILKHNVPLF